MRDDSLALEVLDERMLRQERMKLNLVRRRYGLSSLEKLLQVRLGEAVRN